MSLRNSLISNCWLVFDDQRGRRYKVRVLRGAVFESEESADQFIETLKRLIEGQRYPKLAKVIQFKRKNDNK